MALRHLACGLLVLALGVPLGHAQTIEIQNGGRVAVTNGGVWDLEGSTVDLGPAGADASISETSAGRFAGGQLEATRNLSAPSQADPAGLGIEISASATLGATTVIRGHTVQSGNSNESIERYYELAPSQANSGLSAELVFRYADAELNGLAESNLAVFKSTDGGSTWSAAGFDRRDAQANTVTLSGVESLSRWTLGSEANPLPVELARFEATRTETVRGKDAVRLRWKTAAEQNNAGFEILRRAEGTASAGTSSDGTWKQVGSRSSKAEGGTTTEALTYRFTDEDLPYAADTLAYRLRQVDLDGTATLSEPVLVRRSAPGQLRLLGTAPNPTRQRATVRYAIPQRAAGENAEVRIQLFDMLGRRVKSVAIGGDAGRHTLRLDVSDLASGVYLLRLTSGGQAAVTRKLTVVR